MEWLGQTINPSGDGAGRSFADACGDKQFLEKAAKSKAAGRSSLAAFAKAQLASQAVDTLTICAGAPARATDSPCAPGALVLAQPPPFSRKQKEPSSAPDQAAGGFKFQMEFFGVNNDGCNFGEIQCFAPAAYHEGSLGRDSRWASPSESLVNLF